MASMQAQAAAAAAAAAAATAAAHGQSLVAWCCLTQKGCMTGDQLLLL
jgi:hypothetical protein